MHRAPLVLPAACFLAAIIADEHGLGIVALFAGTALLLIRREAGAGCLAGILAAALHGHPPTLVHELPTARYSGSIVGDIQKSGGTYVFPFAVDGLGTVRAFTHMPVRPGERLSVRGRAAPLDGPRNPGEPSPRALALDDGIIGSLEIEAILRRASPDAYDPRVWTAIMRARLTAAVRGAMPEPQATILAGELWGERGDLPPAVRADFQATGTVHVLVTAGLHLGVIAALASALFGLVRLPRIAASLATIPIVYGYAFFSGWHLPSQRAAAMIAIALIARACGAHTYSLNTLAIAAIVVGAAWPVAVESLSFALSFSCVAAIVLFAEPIAQRITAAGVPAIVAETIGLTVATQVGVWPLTAAVFFVVAPYAILANAVVVPLVGITMTAGIAMLATLAFAPLSAVFARCDTWLLTLVSIATHGIAMLPGARITMTPPPAWSIVAYDAAIVTAALALRRHPGFAVATVAVACIGVFLAANVRPPPGFSVTTLDVGQADATVIRTPRGATILIDAGGKLERGPNVDGQSPAEAAGERIVLGYLRRAGITRIDLLLLTHPHGDHVGACLPIINAMPVAVLFDSRQIYSGRAYRDCIAAAHMHRVPIVAARRGMQWSSGDGVRLDILAPSLPYLSDTGDDVNENSIVAMLHYRDFRELFMGDAGKDSEARLLAFRDDLHADVLKVGHHGSQYASTPTFIVAVHPCVAVISVGRHNTFGHPSPRTLATLTRFGATAYRTDRCGALSLSADRIGPAHTEEPFRLFLAAQLMTPRPQLLTSSCGDIGHQ